MVAVFHLEFSFNLKMNRILGKQPYFACIDLRHGFYGWARISLGRYACTCFL